ncbi:Ankyrin repeat-containing protein [Frankineae bacterium MT45]|nr:Ankyrin repeat-containing protein [Frankineae bacterium MT45]
MPTAPLPEQPNLDQLRKQARELQRAVRRGEPRALALVAEHYSGDPTAETFPLQLAQIVVARHYRFASWAALCRHVEVISARSWVLPPASEKQSVGARFLRLACLNFTEDEPARRVEAAALLAANPELPKHDLAVAAVCADVEAARRLLAVNPTAAQSRCGPYNWSPLMYLTYSRHDGWPERQLEQARDETSVLATAALLIEAGADPNDGRFFLGLPTPFTILTGVFGSADAQRPAHQYEIPLARLLLEAGADPNDGQALYNRMFNPNDDHLRLLFDFGLGRGQGGVWHRLLGDQLDAPAVMLNNLLHWAVTHDQRERVVLLAEHGVDVNAVKEAPSWSRNTGAMAPIEAALLSGNRAMAALLRDLGADEPSLDAVAAFVAAAMAADTEAVHSTPESVIALARAARPGLVVWAASQGVAGAVELLVGVGFDVNAFGRGDTPIEQRWETALHVAAGDGDLELVKSLLRLGADVTLTDKRFDATPLGWAEHFSQPEIAELLRTFSTG